MFIWDKLLIKFWNSEEIYAPKILKNQENPKNSWHFSSQMRGMEIQGLKAHLVPFGYDMEIQGLKTQSCPFRGFSYLLGMPLGYLCPLRYGMKMEVFL